MSVVPFPTTIADARRVLTYSRSSDERLLGVFGQDEEVAQWAEGEGMEIVGFARDLEVHSQSKVDERPALPQVIEAIEEGKADGVVVQRLDRLARDFQTQDDAMKRIWKAGGHVYSTDYGEWKPDRPGDPQWKLRRDYARVAEDELHMIIARMQNARRAMMARGEYGGGRRYYRKYGCELTFVNGRLRYRHIPEEQEVIRRIRHFCANGKGFEAMAKALNAEGVPTVSGKPWKRNTVWQIANRPPDRLFDPNKIEGEVAPIEWVIGS